MTAHRDDAACTGAGVRKPPASVRRRHSRAALGPVLWRLRGRDLFAPAAITCRPASRPRHLLRDVERVVPGQGDNAKHAGEPDSREARNERPICLATSRPIPATEMLNLKSRNFR